MEHHPPREPERRPPAAERAGDARTSRPSDLLAAAEPDAELAPAYAEWRSAAAEARR